MEGPLAQFKCYSLLVSKNGGGDISQAASLALAQETGSSEKKRNSITLSSKMTACFFIVFICYFFGIFFVVVVYDICDLLSSAPTHNGPGAHPVSCTMGTRSFPEVKRPERGVDQPPRSGAKVKERVE